MNVYSTLDLATDAMLGHVLRAQHEELAAYLAKALETQADADLKGLLNRTIKDISFSSKGARAFFEAASRTVNKSLARA